MYLPLCIYAQNDWELPKAEVNKKDSFSNNKANSAKDIEDENLILESNERENYFKRYIAKGTVPEINGMVQWTYEADVPGKSKQQIYNAALNFLNNYSKADNQLEGSGVSLINKKDCTIAARIKQWLVFKDQFLFLDRTKINYTIVVYCSDGHIKITMSHISYKYGEERYDGGEFYKAEELITDKYAIRKKSRKLRGKIGKFRKKTIDLKDQIFQMITASVSQ